MSNEKRVILQERQFNHSFQPICNIQSSDIIGFEALFRSSLTPNPLTTFRQASNKGWLYELEKLSIQKAIQTFQSTLHDQDLKLYINIFPATLLNKDFCQFINREVENNNLDRGKLVIEINEPQVVITPKELQQSVQLLKEEGYQIALDNIGNGASSFITILDLDPDILKVDRGFSEEIHRSTLKQKTLESLQQYCQITNTQLILEGIETTSTLEAARQLNIEMAQGYYLGMPLPINQ
ncbi:EAL domain-containing protein [Alkalibacillus silvisoli]|uniref:EAL domain-containing protein n=1 Tax=Alkalibacillus silvisoli TaxID=392823 RepID=A0ABN1A654_9BACI